MRLGGYGQRVVLAVLTLSCGFLLLACSPSTRYQVLNFFFDGVPPPPGMVPESDNRESTRSRPLSGFATGLATVRETAAAPAPAPRIKSTHQPYQERQCTQCHNMSFGEQADTARDASLCDRCHYDQRHEEGWDHGPINLGTCIPCHVPHASIHESLMSVPVPDLCLDCHLEVTPESPEYHEVPNFSDCVECHDPHRMY